MNCVKGKNQTISPDVFWPMRGEKAESGEISFAAIRETVRQILQEDYPKIQQKPEQADSAEQGD